MQYMWGACASEVGDPDVCLGKEAVQQALRSEGDSVRRWKAVIEHVMGCEACYVRFWDIAQCMLDAPKKSPAVKA